MTIPDPSPTWTDREWVAWAYRVLQAEQEEHRTLLREHRDALREWVVTKQAAQSRQYDPAMFQRQAVGRALDLADWFNRQMEEHDRADERIQALRGALERMAK